MKRDLLAKLPRPLYFNTIATLPVKAGFKKELAIVQRVNVPVLLPHEAFQQIWQSGSFGRTICESPEVLERFWTDIAMHPAVRNHPIRNVADYKRRAIPLVLHGDGAAVTQSIGSGSKSCLFLSWKSLVAKTKDTKDSHILIGAIWSHICVSTPHFSTCKSFWRVVEKSFNLMLTNSGSTGGFFGCLLFTCGDLEYLNSFHGQVRWNSSFPCALCNIPLEKVSNYQSVADLPADPWEPLPRPGEQFPLFQSLLSQMSICPDYMHSKHLGTDQRLAASVAWIVIFRLENEGPLEQRLFNLLEEMKDFGMSINVSFL